MNIIEIISNHIIEIGIAITAIIIFILGIYFGKTNK